MLDDTVPELLCRRLRDRAATEDGSRLLLVLLLRLPEAAGPVGAAAAAV
jgi:hypothetical protein